MIVFQGLNLLSRIAYYMAQQCSIDSALMHTNPETTLPLPDQKALSQRWIMLNHYTLSQLGLPQNIGNEIHRISVYTLQNRRLSVGFHIDHRSFGTPFLAKICQMGHVNTLYPEPENILPFNDQTPCWLSHHKLAPHSLVRSPVGFARQIILKTRGDHHGGFQVFDWPTVMGFLPISATETALVYCCSDAEKIDLPLCSSFESHLKKIMGSTSLNFESIERVGPATPLFSGHASSYRHGIHGLFGEAAHCTHPLAGQGLNMGIADALSLNHISKHVSEHHRLIQIFEKKRWLSNSLIHKFCQQLSGNSARWWAPAMFRAFHRSEAFQRNLFTSAMQIDNSPDLEFTP